MVSWLSYCSDFQLLFVSFHLFSLSFLFYIYKTLYPFAHSAMSVTAKMAVLVFAYFPLASHAFFHATLFRCDYASLYEVVSIRWSVRPSLRRSVSPSVCPSHVIFKY